MKQLFLKIWNWHGWIGKVLTGFCAVTFVLAVIGLCLGVTRCKKSDDIVYTNIFLNEEFSLHDSNYKVTVLSASTKDKIAILNKKGQEELLEGHFLDAEISIYQNPESKQKKHKFDRDDFKLKGHTGVYLPLNDIASLVGWNMIDVHWDKAENGFVISSAEIETEKAVEDYSYVGKTISAGEEITFHVYLPISNKECSVEKDLMVLEIDFFTGGWLFQKKRGEDIILFSRPESLAPQE